MSKICSKCKAEKDLLEFHKRSKSEDGFASWCKECNKNARKASYKKEPSVQKGLARKTVLRNKEYIYQKLLNSSCVDCGENNPCLLEFDHIMGDKVRGVCEGAVRGWSLEKIDKEISKCEIRCICCHRLKTLERSNAYIYRRFYKDLRD